jgi:chitinase
VHAPPKRVGTAAAAGAELPRNWYGAAPYVLALDPPDLSAVSVLTGQRSFDLASVGGLRGGGCAPAWDGGRPVTSDTAVRDLIARVRAAGGDVVVSFGNRTSQSLGEVCPDPRATAEAYQRVVDYYQLGAVDVDLHAAGGDPARTVANEIGAAQILQGRNAGLYVSVTIPGSVTGTDPFGLQVLDRARQMAFTPDNYTVTAFGPGFTNPAAQIAALEAFHDTLMRTFGWDAATAYAHEGFLGVDGPAGSAGSFSPDDFRVVLAYATAHRLGRFTFTSLNGGRSCGGPADRGCSGSPQDLWRFTSFTAAFGGGAAPTVFPAVPNGPNLVGAPVVVPATTPRAATPRAATSPAVADRCGTPAWQAGVGYARGAVVTYRGHAWTTVGAVVGAIPGTGGGIGWTDLGPCATHAPASTATRRPAPPATAAPPVQPAPQPCATCAQALRSADWYVLYRYFVDRAGYGVDPRRHWRDAGFRDFPPPDGFFGMWRRPR